MKYLVALVPVIVLFPLLAVAQGITSQLTPTNHLVLNPPQPEPGELVTVSLDDYAGGFFGAQVTWRFNGEVIPDATNERSITVVAGGPGRTATVEAVLALPQGGTETLSESFTPAYLDVIIEPQTRVPDWYLGRSMPSIGSQVNVTALVNDGTFRDPASLVYTWQVNNRVLDAGPVRGRNKMSFTTPRGDNFLLSVTVSDISGQTVASKIMRVNSVLPSLTYYEQHPLYGSTERPVSASTPIIGNTITLQAEPYNLDIRVYNNPDVAVWEIDSLETTNGTRNPYEITLQQGTVSGQTKVEFHVRSLQEVLQGSRDTTYVTF